MGDWCPQLLPGQRRGLGTRGQGLGSGQWCEGTEVTRPCPLGLGRPEGAWGLEEGFGGQEGREEAGVALGSREGQDRVPGSGGGN